MEETKHNADTTENPDVCRWQEVETCCWDSGCGITWTLEDGTPSECDMNFCAKCGKPLEEVFVSRDDDTETEKKEREKNDEPKHIIDSTERQDVCHWREDENGGWDSDCELGWHFEEGAPKENDMAFCFKCGLPLEEVFFKYDEDEDDEEEESWEQKYMKRFR